MTRSRIWTVGTALAVVLILAAGWFLLVSPERAEATSVQEQTVTQQEANAQLANKIEQLKIQAADLPQQEAKLAKFRQRIPAQPALPSFIRSLSSIAKESNVFLVSVEPQTPAALATAEEQAPATTDDGTGEASTGTDTSVTLNSAPPSTVQYVQAQVTLEGGYFNTEQFVAKMERLERSFLVTGFDITVNEDPDAKEGDVITNLQVRVFFAPLPVDPSTTTTTASN